MSTFSSARRWRAGRPWAASRSCRRRRAGRAASASTLSPRASLIASRSRGSRQGKSLTRASRLTSVGAGIDAATQWDEVERLFNAARCAVSNTADRGYETDPADRPDAGPPRSFPAKLAKLLLARHRAGAEPITLFPCELTPANGKALRAAVLGVLDRWDVPRESAAVGRGRVLVGQFAGRPHRLRAARTGRRGGRALCALGDRGPTADFELPCRHASITVTGDLKPYERLKLFILNLGHTYLAEIWARGGRRADAYCSRSAGRQCDPRRARRSVRQGSAAGICRDRNGTRGRGLPGQRR